MTHDPAIQKGERERQLDALTEQQTLLGEQITKATVKIFQDPKGAELMRKYTELKKELSTLVGLSLSAEQISKNPSQN